MAIESPVLTWSGSAAAIAAGGDRRTYELFLDYKGAGDFVGVDMARKFLQMGYTRARRYANHRSGRKYDPATRQLPPQEADWATGEKAQAARIFYGYYRQARDDPDYQRAKCHHQVTYG